ncbi:hypothetical protein GQ44DRAFT_766583 [Phaeosphaeriaceae sp. PMI808]|nr:hypothetical protein GQ44DRAFT_766583 [Phaeosphaeriaceae sp. PMI808]
MGNRASKQPELNSKSIEEYYATLAVERHLHAAEEAAMQPHPSTNLSPLHPDVVEPGDSNIDRSVPVHGNTLQDNASFMESGLVVAMKNSSMFSNTIGVALKSGIKTLKKVRATLESAAKAIMKLDIKKAAPKYMKDHPWEAAAIISMLTLVGCTPVILSIIGFTANGIAAGSIAAGIHAMIGNVTAGSAFAILTSAGMADYGLPIVLFSAGIFGFVGTFGIKALWERFMNGGDESDKDD